MIILLQQVKESSKLLRWRQKAHGCYEPLPVRPLLTLGPTKILANKIAWLLMYFLPKDKCSHAGVPIMWKFTGSSCSCTEVSPRPWLCPCVGIWNSQMNMHGVWSHSSVIFWCPFTQKKHEEGCFVMYISCISHNVGPQSAYHMYWNKYKYC